VSQKRANSSIESVSGILAFFFICFAAEPIG
jgi:hypothetical protein